jgi:hypothetical protein
MHAKPQQTLDFVYSAGCALSAYCAGLGRIENYLISLIVRRR